MKYQVTITNGLWEKVETIKHGWCDSVEMAEKMVEGLLNREWSVVKGKTVLVGGNN